jgi:hypothetical protein
MTEYSEERTQESEAGKAKTLDSYAKETADEKELLFLLENLTLSGMLKWKRIWNPFNSYKYKTKVGPFKFRIWFPRYCKYVYVNISDGMTLEKLSIQSDALRLYFSRKRAVAPTSEEVISALRELLIP